METDINFSQAPTDYRMCLNRECPKAGTCLRQLIVPTVPADVEYWSIISPAYLSALKDDCPHYRPATKVRFAKGFVRLLDNLPYKQTRTVVAHLMEYFNGRTYFRVRRGERLLSPSEQKQFFNILRNCGVTTPQEFDDYVEEFEW